MNAPASRLQNGRKVVSRAAWLAAALSLVWGVPVRADDKPQGGKDRWSVVEVGRNGKVAVRLRVLKQATLADEKWLVIELDNQGDSPVQPCNPWYRITADRFDLRSGKPTGPAYAYLCMGQDREMLPRQRWPVLLPPGIHQVADPPSDDSASILGLPPKEGLTIKAKLDLRFDIQERPDTTTSPGRVRHFSKENVAFQFDWLYPDEEALGRARHRLKDLLAEPGNDFAETRYLGMLLRVDEVRSAVGVADLLAALQRRTGPFSGRQWLAEHLDKRFPNDRSVTRYYQDCLEAGDIRVMDDLFYAQGIWQDDFVEPLVKMFQRDPWHYHYWILSILNRHWKGEPDPKITGRLSAAWVHVCPWFAIKLPAQAAYHETWVTVIGGLGETRDRAWLPKLATLLDDKTVVYGEPLWARDANPLEAASRPSRACDVALEAMLTILDGSPQKVYREAAAEGKQSPVTFSGVNSKEARRKLAEAMQKVRDKIIARLKREWVPAKGATGGS